MNPTGSFSSLDDWLVWLETLSPREIVLGLERVHVVLDRLELARPETVIHIAGTNGKGSSAAMLESLLREGGVRTGCYTSPHISSYNERIRLDGEPAGDESIVQALKLVEAVRGDVPLTYFEFGTLAAVVAFDAADVDAWILEVGLGGRLDAVNAIEPDASLITNVSLDHCAWLGNETEAIAAEKAGVMRQSRPTVFGSRDVPEAIRDTAAKIGANLIVAGEDFAFEKEPGDAQQWLWRGQHLEIAGLDAPALAGEIQLQNAAAVLAVLEALEMDHFLTPGIVNSALAGIVLEGRFQIVDRRSRWILDVAHNPGAAGALANQLSQQEIEGKVTAIVGMLADKDIEGVIAPIRDLVDTWITVTVRSDRAESAASLAQHIASQCDKPCLIGGSIAGALEIAENGSRDTDVIVVTGSFYIVGPALEWLRAN